MSRLTPLVPEECWDCILPDCYDWHRDCRQQQKKHAEQGTPLPPRTEAPTGQAGRPKKIREKKKPKPKKKQHNQKALINQRKVLAEGVKVRKCDLLFLSEYYEAKGKRWQDEAGMVLETWAADLRRKAQESKILLQWADKSL